MSQLFASGGQSIGVSASTLVLPMNTQDIGISFRMENQPNANLGLLLINPSLSLSSELAS